MLTGTTGVGIDGAIRLLRVWQDSSGSGRFYRWKNVSTGSTGAEAVEPLGQENLPQAWNFAGKMNMVGARYDMCKK
jgi:hypothetical protein